MKRIFSILLASAVLALAACGGQAHAQGIPAPVAYPLDDYVAFGPYQSVDLAHARSVDLVNGNWQVTDANGNIVTGNFTTPGAFYNASAFKRYVRTTYNGGYRWWNTYSMGRVACYNTVTSVYWINGPATAYADQCSLQQLLDQYARKN